MRRLIENPSFIAASTVLLLAAALWIPFGMHASMDMTMPGSSPMTPVAPAQWSMGVVRSTAAMWLLMMLAMMLPSMTPMIATYTSVAAQEDHGAMLAARVALFTLGYFALWGVFSIAAALAQLALRGVPGFSADGTTSTPFVAGFLMIVAGAYQLTPVKDMCLRHCRSPLTYLLAHWRGGIAGGFRVGLHHGAYCVGCCGVFMILMFIFGTMTVWWMAVLAVYFVAEKMLPHAEQWSRLVGIALILAGVATLALTFNAQLT